ncbi:T9SS type A sorting domain-containing protein [Bacteroidales bacterium]|nr:T9SS type A sorting domain-containing protein [Bacteroidales bacterium]
MKNNITPHTLNEFYEEFKNLPSSYKIGRVQQLLDSPNAKAMLKIKKIKPLNVIIMTLFVSVAAIVLMLCLTPATNQTENTETNAYPLEDKVFVAEEKKEPNAYHTNANENMAANLKDEEVVQYDKELKTQTDRYASAHQAFMPDTTIDGSKFILELSHEELGKLGFQINHYTVFYRNSYEDNNVFYLATRFMRGGRARRIKTDSNTLYLKSYHKLQIDTLPAYPVVQTRGLYTKKYHMYLNDSNKVQTTQNTYHNTDYSFYPLFNTNQKGKIESINDQLSFNDMADSLIPIVIKNSQLAHRVRIDQFFWFLTNDSFYSKLPKRYAWVKQDFEALKLQKYAMGNKLDVDFKTEVWQKDLLIPDSEVLNGRDKIIRLTEAELNKIGIFRNEKAKWKYAYQTPHGSNAAGLENWFVDGKFKGWTADTIFNEDFYPVYSTDYLGDFLFNSTTIKTINKFLDNNDVLLPVQAVCDTGNIYWFSLSEKLWSLIPQRYKHLQEYYNTMLYNKSLHPQRDFVKYFNDPFEKASTNIPYLELSKVELEQLGFVFEYKTITSETGEKEKHAIGAILECGFNKNWIKYKSTDPNNFRPWVKNKIVRRVREMVAYISPGDSAISRALANKFDSLYQVAPNKGYQFVYFTDSLGRHMKKIYIKNEDIGIAPDDFMYLIPVMVRWSDLLFDSAEDRVFWFTPTEDFFNRLPERIREDIKREYNIVSLNGENTESSACTYFESCRSTLPVENMKVYPNPASFSVSVEFDASETYEGSISMANIAGTKIKTLVANTTFVTGFNTYHFNLSGVAPGVYLISINTNKGFKTKRLIVTQ